MDKDTRLHTFAKDDLLPLCDDGTDSRGFTIAGNPERVTCENCLALMAAQS